jgi:drug/metabolite transporter (DMT)-like permease
MIISSRTEKATEELKVLGEFEKQKYLDQMKGPFYLFCAFTLAGTSVLAAEYVSVKLGTFTITAVSQFFALLFLLPFCRGKMKEELRAMSQKDFAFLFVQALFGMFLFRMFLIIGLTRTSAGEAGILTGATPAITAVLARLTLKEPAGGKKTVGILSTVIGVFLIQGLLTPGNRFSMENFTGNMLVLCAAGCESLFNILSRLFVRSDDTHSLHPAVQTAYVSAITMALCLVPAMFEDPLGRLFGIGPGEWFALLWYGVFVTALAFMFWYAGISRCGAITAAAFSGMMPFTSLLLSVLLLGEQAGLRQWSGGALVIAGIILIGSGAASGAKEPDKAVSAIKKTVSSS